MTIPTIISKTTEKVTVSRLKKTYSTFESAFQSAISENGSPDNWGMTAGLEEHNANNPDEKSGSASIVLNNIAPYLNLNKNCGQKSGCMPKGYKWLGGKLWSQDPDITPYFAKAQLADGTFFVIDVHSPSCDKKYGTNKLLQNVCGAIHVDINGYNKPNQVGKDLFFFWYTKLGVIPFGTQAENTYSFAKGCRNVSGNTGYGCTAWVIYNENMDYLHCNDLSWEDKKSCK